MTVASTARKQSFTIATGTSDYDFTFRALTSAPADIKCTVTDGDGVDAALTYRTDYSVAVNSDGVGGTVTLVAPEDYDTYTLTVYRETTNTQESDYEDYNQFPADTLETDLDRRTMVAQEAGEDLSRSLKVSVTSTLEDLELPAPTASTIIGWNAAADGLQNYTPTEAGTDTLQIAFDNGESITIANGDDKSLTLAQNDTTNNPVAFSITCATTSSCVSLLATGSNPHINFLGDPTVASPIDGDFWFTGTSLNFRNGTSTVDLLNPLLTTGFLAIPAANQTHIATASTVDIAFATEVFDLKSNFSIPSFTAPATGKYLFSWCISLADVDTDSTALQILLVTSNRTYSGQIIHPNDIFSVDTSYSIQGSIIADMDINDTAKIQIEITGGVHQTDVTTGSWFSGMRVA